MFPLFITWGKYRLCIVCTLSITFVKYRICLMCLSYLVNIVIALYFQSCGTNIVVALYYLSCGVKFVFALCTLLKRNEGPRQPEPLACMPVPVPRGTETTPPDKWAATTRSLAAEAAAGGHQIRPSCLPRQGRSMF